MERQPWFKWYPASWRGDDNVKGCSLAARGLWRECLDIMHNAPQRGYLVGQNGPLSDVDLAHFVGRPLKEVRGALLEIENQKVSSRTNDGILFSRRMVRDTERLAKAAADGSKGGKASLGHTLKGRVEGSLESPLDPARAQTRVLVSNDLSSKTKEASELAQARFETFWDAYPKREAKKDAYRAFSKLKLTPETFAELLDGVKRAKLTEQWKNLKFIPLPATWLNGERWKDQPQTAQDAPGSTIPVPRLVTGDEIRQAREAAVEAAGGPPTLEQFHALRASLRRAAH